MLRARCGQAFPNAAEFLGKGPPRRFPAAVVNAVARTCKKDGQKRPCQRLSDGPRGNTRAQLERLLGAFAALWRDLVFFGVSTGQKGGIQWRKN